MEALHCLLYGSRMSSSLTGHHNYQQQCLSLNTGSLVFCCLPHNYQFPNPCPYILLHSLLVCPEVGGILLQTVHINFYHLASYPNIQQYSENYIYIYIYIYIHRVSQEECARLRESVPYVKLYRYNPKHLFPKLNGYGDNGQRSLKL